MKHIILIFIILLIPVSALAFEAHGLKLEGNPEDGWVLTLPEGEVYYMDWVGDRIRTAGMDGVCYFYDGDQIEECTLKEYSIFIYDRS